MKKCPKTEQARILFYSRMTVMFGIYVFSSSFPVDFFIKVDLTYSAPSASLSFRQHMPACFIFSGHYMRGLAGLSLDLAFLRFLIPVHLKKTRKCKVFIL